MQEFTTELKASKQLNYSIMRSGYISQSRVIDVEVLFR